MNRTNFDRTISPELQRILNFIMDGAVGSLITLSADVTTVGGELEPGQIGFNPTTRKLFWNIEGITYLVSTLTTT